MNFENALQSAKNKYLIKRENWPNLLHCSYNFSLNELQSFYGGCLISFKINLSDMNSNDWEVCNEDGAIYGQTEVVEPVKEEKLVEIKETELQILIKAFDKLKIRYSLNKTFTVNDYIELEHGEYELDFKFDKEGYYKGYEMFKND
jgi:hypothetical protein